MFDFTELPAELDPVLHQRCYGLLAVPQLRQCIACEANRRCHLKLVFRERVMQELEGVIFDTESGIRWVEESGRQWAAGLNRIADAVTEVLLDYVEDIRNGSG